MEEKDLINQIEDFSGKLENLQLANDDLTDEVNTYLTEKQISLESENGGVQKLLIHSLKRMENRLALNNDLSSSLESDNEMNTKAKIIASLEAKESIIKRALETIDQLWEKFKNMVLTILLKSAVVFNKIALRGEEIRKDLEFRDHIRKQSGITADDFNRIKYKFAGILYRNRFSIENFDKIEFDKVYKKSIIPEIGKDIKSRDSFFTVDSNIKSLLDLKNNENALLITLDNGAIEYLRLEYDENLDKDITEDIYYKIDGKKYNKVRFDKHTLVNTEIDTITANNLPSLEALKAINKTAMGMVRNTGMSDYFSDVRKTVSDSNKMYKDLEKKYTDNTDENILKLLKTYKPLLITIPRTGLRDIYGYMNISRDLMWLVERLREYYPKTK
jgi:hypothetical protein